MKSYLYKSFAMHLMIFIILMLDLPLFFWNERNDMRQVPIIVDLKDVKIAEMTNLPPKAKFDKEDKQGTKTEKKKEEKVYTKEEKAEPKGETVPKEAKETPKEEAKTSEEPAVPPKKDFMVAPQPKKPQAPQAKKEELVKKEAPKKDLGKKDGKEAKGSPELANPLKNLLASVDDIEKKLGAENTDTTIKEGTEVNNMGIEGGIGGSYFSELTISEIDAIAGRLRACWNVDPGARGIENMIIEVRAFLNQDGTVRDVKILDTSRYGSDPHFRSVADSAKRAVFVCAPYTVFSERYADKYDKWKTMRIKFNPMDGSVR